MYQLHLGLALLHRTISNNPSVFLLPNKMISNHIQNCPFSKERSKIIPRITHLPCQTLITTLVSAPQGNFLLECFYCQFAELS